MKKVFSSQKKVFGRQKIDSTFNKRYFAIKKLYSEESVLTVPYYGILKN